MADAAARHADHDPVAIAALLDRDLPAPDRVAGQARVAACSSCAALFDDLVAVSKATVAQPTLARPRDFALTKVDAERLRVHATGEPAPGSPRLTGVKTDTHGSRAHETHDKLLVAALGDRTLTTSEREAAETLVATCGMCAALHADLTAIAAATRTMAAPARPRDFTVSELDAARLRRTGWRRLVAAFGTSRDALSRPLAMGLTTLGVVGLLVANVPSLSIGGQTSGAAPGVESLAGPADEGGEAPRFGASASQSPVPPSVEMVPADRSTAALGPHGDITGEGDPAQTAAPAAAQGDNGTTGVLKGPAGATNEPDRLAIGADATTRDRANGLSTLVIVSGLFVIVGLGLFAFRWSARHLGHD